MGTLPSRKLDREWTVTVVEIIDIAPVWWCFLTGCLLRKEIFDQLVATTAGVTKGKDIKARLAYADGKFHGFSSALLPHNFFNWGKISGGLKGK